MERVRTFIAIELAEEMRADFARIQDCLKDELSIPVRWVRLEGIHLTLKFLGQVAVTDLEAVGNAMAQAAAQAAFFSISLGQPGGFPSLGTPRVLWVGIQGDVQAVYGL